MLGTEPSLAQLEAIERMAQSVDDGPFTMVNIIKYKDQATYPEGCDEPPQSGRQAYAQYTGTVGPLIYALVVVSLINNGVNCYSWEMKTRLQMSDYRQLPLAYGLSEYVS